MLVAYLWKWFGDLTDWRESGFGVGPLSHQEIESWARLLRVDISPCEVEALRRLDRTYRMYRYEKDHPEEAAKKNQQPGHIGASLLEVAKTHAALKAQDKSKPKPKPKGKA